MKLVLRIALCCSLAAGVGVAQRRGGGGSTGGGFRGGGGVTRGGMGGSVFRGGGGITRGGMGGGVFRGGGGITRGGMGGGVFRGGGGIGRSWGFRGGYGGYGGYYGGYGSYYSPYVYSGFGLGYGYSPWYDDYGYSSYSDYRYPVYQPSPNVNVVYAPPAPATVYVERPNPITREYDQYGQQTNRPTSPTDSGSPIYLIAFRDHTIRAAAAYWAEGGTLHYVTPEHEQKQAALSTVDRDLSGQLNRERRVAFSLPASQ
jgi:hypothetical protein